MSEPRKPKTRHPERWRAKPDDFRDRYIEIGWEWIVQHYRTSWQCVVRWIDEEGREELKAARSAYVRQHGITQLHPHR